MRTQLLHYSDFFFREMDWWIGTMLYLCLLLLTLLPISYLHSKMLFNSAFADTLSQVNKPNSLTLTTHPHHSPLTTHHSTFTLTLALPLTRLATKEMILTLPLHRHRHHSPSPLTTQPNPHPTPNQARHQGDDQASLP